MPRPNGGADAMARWIGESLPACCRHRLELLKAFQYLEVPQFGRLLWIDMGWPRDLDQPAYLKFLDEAEKLSRPEVVREARRVAAYIVSTRTWRPPPAPLPARPAMDRGAAEVAFRRIDLMVRRPDGGEASYSGRPLLWLPACDGMDVVLDEWALYVMRRPGRLVPLALPGHPNPNFAAGRQVTNACWDGRYVWFASPAADPGTPKRVTGGGQSGLEYAPGGKPFLAAVEPATGKVWTFSAADGLPPMKSPGGPAVTPLEPGKICLAGHFGRSWCGVATLDPAAGIKLDIFYEAREVDPETNPANGQNVRLASPVAFLCTLTSAAAAGEPPQQRVLLNRQAAGTLLLDPRTRLGAAAVAVFERLGVGLEAHRPEIARGAVEELLQLFGLHGAQLAPRRWRPAAWSRSPGGRRAETPPRRATYLSGRHLSLPRRASAPCRPRT